MGTKRKTLDLYSLQAGQNAEAGFSVIKNLSYHDARDTMTDTRKGNRDKNTGRRTLEHGHWERDTRTWALRGRL